MEEDSLVEYKSTLMSRYDGLEDAEKATLRGLNGTAEGMVLEKILGPEMEDVGMMLASKPAPIAVPKRRGLATR
jgi:hypothetical protein